MSYKPLILWTYQCMMIYEKQRNTYIKTKEKERVMYDITKSGGRYRKRHSKSYV